MKWIIVLLIICGSGLLYAEDVAEVGPSTDLKESEIPVLSATKPQRVEKSSSTAKVFVSMAVISLLAGGLLYFSRWYSKNHRVNESTNKIRILTQHFLGPRKSLAIIRVAGETLLIGVTDQNISMLKSLSLLDEEVPDNVANSFQSSLENASKKNDRSVSSQNEEEEFIIGSIKDKVSTKLKNMRPI